VGRTPVVIDRGRRNITFIVRGLAPGIDNYKRSAAQRGVQIAQGYFDKGGPDNDPWPKLHGWTLENKTTSKIMVETSGLRNSIRVVQVGKGIGFGSYHPIAPIHEFGPVTITITDKMRAYLHHHGFHLKPDTKKMVIPRRWFLTPAAKELEDDLPDLFKNSVEETTRVRGF